MNKELLALQEKIQAVKLEASGLVGVDNAKAKTLIEEAKDLQEQFNLKSQLLEEEKENVIVNKQSQKVENKETVAFMKAIKGSGLTEELKNALTTTDEGVLVPEQVATQINEALREYPSVRELVDVIPVSTSKGSIPVEQSGNVSALVDFEEGAELAEQTASFTSVSFNLPSKGAFVPLSRNLLADENKGLPAYLTRLYAKKVAKTENLDIFAALKAGKAAKAVADVQGLIKVITKDLDPAIAATSVVVTNQDGFYHLEQEKDANGNFYLQKDVADASKYTFKGKPVRVYSNDVLPTTGTTTKKAPIFVGNLKEAVKLFDRGQYEVATSEHAAFIKNQNLMRIIARFEAKIGDVDAYIHGEIDVTATI